MIPRPSRPAFLLLLLPLCALGQTATIKIDVDHVIGRIDPHIYGVFMEPINARRGGPNFNTLYGPVYDPKSPLADKEGFRTDIIQAARELELTQMRWPGGNFTAVYDWRDGIGPKADRPRRLNLAWGGVESNQVGTDEWVELNREIGSDDVVCINAGTGTIPEAADWVAYCNAPAGTYWADKRVADGHARPYDIRYWCLGNEVDGAPWIIGHKTAGDYVKFAVEVAKAMRASSPGTKLEFIASGSSYYQDNLDWVNWNWKVIQGLYGVADYLSIHRYWGAAKDYYVLLGQRERELEEKIDITAGQLKAVADVRHGGPMYLSIDEWAPPFGGGALSTLVLAEYFNAFLRHADVVKMANYTLLTSILGRDFQTGRTYKTPLFYAFKLFSTRCRGEALDPFVECGTFSTSDHYRDLPFLDVSSVYNAKTGRIVVNVVNRHKEKSVATDIQSITGRFAPTSEVSEIASVGVADRPYTYAERASYPPKTERIATTGSAIHYTFPPHSFTQIVVGLSRP
ncbi:MAG: alpha-L-arabinofuranosidase C-terminal domain-containing protein [Opitutaceae bacterium]